MQPKLLVIGGTGFIGHHLLESAMKLGWQSTSISLNNPSNERMVEGVQYFKLDFKKRELVYEVLKDEQFIYVVNLGGYIDHSLLRLGGGKIIDTHFTGLKTLVEILNRKCLKSFVQIGSSDEYGNLLAPQNENLRESPISPYSLAKTAATHFLQMLHRTEKFPAVVLRLFLTYGPGQDQQRFLPQIIKGCLEDKTFDTSSGGQIRDFCYISDTVRAILMALNNDKVAGNIFNIASGKPIRIREVIEKIQALIGKGTPSYGKIPYRTGENMSLYADISKANKVLNWRPHVNLDNGLQKTINWYIEK